jgi:hypothetical protein
MADTPPGKGFFGWIGRQIGHVKRAVKQDVTKEVIHREKNVQEASLPDRPEVKLRRTVIDEVIVDRKNGHQDKHSSKQ